MAGIELVAGSVAVDELVQVRAPVLGEATNLNAWEIISAATFPYGQSLLGNAEVCSRFLAREQFDVCGRGSCRLGDLLVVHELSAFLEFSDSHFCDRRSEKRSGSPTNCLAN